jgi:hypothetical protein
MERGRIDVQNDEDDVYTEKQKVNINQNKEVE